MRDKCGRRMPTHHWADNALALNKFGCDGSIWSVWYIHDVTVEIKLTPTCSNIDISVAVRLRCRRHRIRCTFNSFLWPWTWAALQTFIAPARARAYHYKCLLCLRFPYEEKRENGSEHGCPTSVGMLRWYTKTPNRNQMKFPAYVHSMLTSIRSGFDKENYSPTCW